MIDKIFLLSHPKFYERNLNFIIETFINNNYPLQFIFNTIQIRLKSLFNKRNKLLTFLRKKGLIAGF